MNRQFLTFGAVAVIFVAVGVYFGWQKTAPESAAPSVSEQFFSQTLPDASGTSQSLVQWKGKPLVVNFWATWCSPCVKEMPELAALQTEIGPQHAQIIGIGIDSAQNIAAFGARHHITYPLYVAGNDGIAMSRLFGNQAGGLPFTVLLDADGVIKKTYLGVKIDDLRADLNRL